MNTPNYLYFGKLAFFIQQSSLAYFLNVVFLSSAVHGNSTHILQTDWLVVFEADAKLHHFLCFHW